jgi:nucleoside-diphosphate-sugar epimerase
MKLFVTGATGFVGAHFVRQAIEAGHSVRASRRLGRLTEAAPPMLEWLDVELDEIGASHFEACDALIHFAAAGVSPKQASRQEMTHWNVTVPQSLLEHAHTAGLRRIVIAGSFAEYGASANAHELIPPDAPLLPTTSYASSKAACFVTCHAIAIELGLELCYLRIFSAYGEGQFESNFWPALKKAARSGEDFAMTAGEQIRDYVPVDDVAASFLHAALRRDVSPGTPLVYNVGSGQPVTMREFALRWWRHWNAAGELRIGALPYRPNEVMRFAPLITEAMTTAAVRS